MKIRFSDEREPEKHVRSLTWTTRWFSVAFDFGATLLGERDEFNLPTLRRGWGLAFHCGKQPLKRTSAIPKRNWLYFTTNHPAYIQERRYWADLERHFNENQLAIRRGERPHPAMMTRQERHQATAEIVRKMKWSKSFVRAITMPMVQRALESGGAMTNEWGDQVSLNEEEMKQLESAGIQQARLNWEGTLPFSFQLTDGDLDEIKDGTI